MLRILHSSSSRRATSSDRQEGRERLLYGGGKAGSSRSSGINESARTVPAQSRRALCRTRSESDMIRAMARRKADRRKRRSWGFDSDDESENSTEDNSRRAMSLQSFTKDDEDRYATASLEKKMPIDHMCSKIGEEGEETNSSLPPSQAEESTLQDSSLEPSRSRASGKASESTASPVTDHIVMSNPSAPPSQAASSSASPDKEQDIKSLPSSRSGNDSTCSSSDLRDSEVDLEYLLHENDLLKTSLDNVVRERDYLAQDNWNLRVELENLRNQMRFMMVSPESPCSLLGGSDASHYQFVHTSNHSANKFHSEGLMNQMQG